MAGPPSTIANPQRHRLNSITIPDLYSFRAERAVRKLLAMTADERIMMLPHIVDPTAMVEIQAACRAWHPADDEENDILEFIDDAMAELHAVAEARLKFMREDASMGHRLEGELRQRKLELKNLLHRGLAVETAA